MRVDPKRGESKFHTFKDMRVHPKTACRGESKFRTFEDMQDNDMNFFVVGKIEIILNME